MPAKPASEPSRADAPIEGPLDTPDRTPGLARVGFGEGLTAAALMAVTLGLHVFYVFRWTFDSDEWQHLHVAWAWTQGLLQYRDVFDNHTPLFHMLTAPILAAFGETPDILFFMRLAMLPCLLVTLAASAAIAFGLFGRRAALWTPIVLAAVPVFFFRSIEYRTDALWVAFWVVAVAVLVAGTPGRGRSLGVGLLLGLALVTSLKTVLLLFALAIATLLTPLVLGREARGVPLRRRLPLLLPALFGMAIPPALLVVYFAHRGALQALLDGAIRHNILPGLGTWQSPVRPLLFLPEIAGVAALAAWQARRHRPPGTARRAAFLVLLAGAFLAALQTLWPLFTTYDLLVFYPVVVPVVVGSMLYGGPRAGTTTAAWRFPALAVLLLALVLAGWPPQQEGVSAQRAFLAEVLALTDREDPVLDQKGEAIYRHRPIPYVLERITRVRLARGLLPETIQEDIARTGTCVAAWKIGRFPERTRRFLVENFLPVGHLMIAGRLLPAAGADGDPSGSFEIAVPARYALVSETGTISGTLDGEPYTGPRRLDAGLHTFRIFSTGSRVAVIWAKAAERGFLPFHPGVVDP